MTSPARRIHRLLAGDDDTTDLPAGVVDELPGNAAKLVGALSATSAGDAVVDPKTVLAWLLTGVGVPLGFVAMLVPVREAGSLVPQVAIAPFVRRLAIRKWAWAVSALTQATMVVVVAIAATTLTGAPAGWVVLGAVAGFAIARSVASMVSKDVLGKTVPEGRRGSVSGVAAAVSGLAAVAIGSVIAVVGGADTPTSLLAWLLVGGAGMFVAVAAAVATIAEPPGERDTVADRATVGDMVSLLRSDAALRRFVVVRALLFVTALSPPFVVVMAAGGDRVGLGPFVVASGMAALVAAPAWGRLADLSSRRVMAAAAGLGAVVVVAYLLVGFVSGGRAPAWVGVGAYFLLAVAHGGARIGRKVYVVDMAEGNRRTDYVAVSNTAIGLLLLVVGGLGAALSALGPEWSLGLLAAMGVAGALGVRALPEVGAPAG